MPPLCCSNAGANVINSGNLSWEGGRFIGWSGRFTHQAGRQFDIWGDFNSAGGGGKLVNSGTVTKQSGTGRSELAMGFDNIGGTVRALSGTPPSSSLAAPPLAGRFQQAAA